MGEVTAFGAVSMWPWSWLKGDEDCWVVAIFFETLIFAKYQS
jgi:hypothetical protein